MTRWTGREATPERPDRGEPRIIVGDSGRGVGLGVAGTGAGLRLAGGSGALQRLAGERGEADLHAIGDGVGGGPIDLSPDEHVGDAKDVGQNSGGFFRVFKRDGVGRVRFAGIRDRDGSEVVGLQLDLAAEA